VAQGRIRGTILGLGLCLLSGVGAWGASTSMTGTDFWLAFLPNYPPELGPNNLALYITSVQGATGSVNIASLGVNLPFTVAANGATTVAIPTTIPLGDGTSYELVENKGIEVSASNPVAVYGLNNEIYTSDGFLCLPDQTLDTDYYTLGYYDTTGSDLGVVAWKDNTTLTITLPIAFDNHAAGVPYTVPLNQGQTYFLWVNEATLCVNFPSLCPLGTPPQLDLSGTHIQSNNPVAVYAGDVCADVPITQPTCDILVEQMFPTSLWGQEYLSVPLGTRTGGDTFRVLASQNNTSVSVNGANVATLNQGTFWEGILSSASMIQASAPVLVGQYADGQFQDGDSNSDSSEMLLQPLGLFGDDYILSPDTVDFTVNQANLVVPAAAVGAVTINGVPVPAASFSAIGASGYFGAAVTLTCAVCLLDSPLPMGVSAYGWGAQNAYSYPGGSCSPPSPTATFSWTPTATPSATPTASPTATPSISPTFSITPTFSVTPSFSVTSTITPTSTASPTATATPPPLLLTPHFPNPNPAGSGGVWLPYTISTDAWVDLEVFDVAGEKVRGWNSDPDFEFTGDHERYWDLRNSAGADTASGVFLVRIHARSPRDENATVWEKCAVLR
jgi:hypothetical protein